MEIRVGLIFFLSAAVPLKFFRVQHLTAASPSGTPSIVTREARMHQDAANRVRSEAARLIPSTVYAVGDADRF